MSNIGMVVTESADNRDVVNIPYNKLIKGKEWFGEEWYVFHQNDKKKVLVAFFDIVTARFRRRLVFLAAIGGSRLWPLALILSAFFSP